jgi:hypothetical protein
MTMVCDRCGEIFNRKVPDINDCYGTANSILFLDCTVERNRFGLGEEPIQLCPSCMKELNDWLEPNEEKLDNGNKNEWNNMTTQPQCGVAVEIKLENWPSSSSNGVMYFTSLESGNTSPHLSHTIVIFILQSL